MSPVNATFTEIIENELGARRLARFLHQARLAARRPTVRAPQHDPAPQRQTPALVGLRGVEASTATTSEGHFCLDD
jgi:hypothetical protein